MFIIPISASDEIRFWKYVSKPSSTTCWLWTGGLYRHGYGHFKCRGNADYYAHRFSWELHNKSDIIPNGNSKILHTCDVRNCVNPEHLVLGTQADNMQDMYAKGRDYKGPRYWLHRRQGEGHPLVQLTDQSVRDIRRRAAAGETQQKLADEYNVTQAHISKIVRRVTWKHI